MALSDQVLTWASENQKVVFNKAALVAWACAKWPDKKMLIQMGMTAIGNQIPDATVVMCFQFMTAFLVVALQHADVCEVVDKLDL